MSNTQVGPLLRFIRQLSIERNDNEMPDYQLLERFASLQDESAFAALLRRHGRMVLSVCQSVLHNLHDAEDVFQAVFLVLAQKAGSIQRREAVSSWLYGVTHRLAMKAKASAARRKDLEKRAAVMPSADPLLDLNLRELRGVLYEELNRLPENYRSPLVLCYLEEKTQEEAARLLGWSKATVNGRLQRGRELLRKRLRQRGLTLSASLTASALALGAASVAVPASLSASTLQAASKLGAGKATAAGLVSASVAALVEGASTMMFVNKAKIVTILLVILSAAVAGFAAVRHGVRAANPPEDAKSAEATKSENRPTIAEEAKPAPRDSITVRGRVLDPDGKPVAGAKLYLGHFGPKDEITVTERAKSDADGRFEFRFPKSQLSKVHFDRRIGHTFGAMTPEWFEPQPRDETDPFFTPVGQVIAIAEGFGCDWTRLNSETGSTELNLRLVKDVPLTGRILDPDGKPVAGAKLYLSSVQAYTGEKLDAALAQFHKSNEFPAGEKRWGGPLPGQARPVTTGPEGRFRMDGLGGERYVSLHIEGPGIASTDFQLITRLGDMVVGPDKIKADPRYRGADTREIIEVTPSKICGATFRYLAAASRPIRGVVTDKVTGKPLAGVMIRVAPRKGSHDAGNSFTDFMLTTHTDGQGRYEMVGCPKSPRYKIAAQPPDTARYFAVMLSEISDAPGIGPMTADIQLPQGIPIRGKVLDEQTGKPIAGARVNYFRLHPNAAGAIAFADYYFAGSNTIAGLDGSFAVAALPGPGILVASAPDTTGHARSKAYRPGKVTGKEWDAFVAKHKVPPGQFPPRKKWDDAEQREVMEYAPINQHSGLTEGILQFDCFNSLVLLHPYEKDKELKLDLKLRPNDGDGKSKDEPTNDKKP